MFSIDIDILTWILIGVQILTGVITLNYVLRPLKALQRLPIIYREPAAAEEETEEETIETETEEETAEETVEAQTEEETAEETVETETEEETAEEAVETETEEETGIATPQEEKLPKVSVVVFSTVNEETLTEFLRNVCDQDYPDFEVIVVCDATFETSGILAEKYEELFGNVYVTFIPPGSHNLSRRKLALTLGIKAAKGDIVLTTVASALIPSRRWISGMTEPFLDNPSLELSLGYSHPDYQEITGCGKYYKEFFQFLTDARWIGYALMEKPFRGDGYNIAFLRSTFFRCKGYSKTMHLHTGEDDLFVAEIADAYNTAVVITPETILTTRSWGAAKRIFNLRRSQYDFTSRWLPTAPFVRSAVASWAQWIVLLSGVGAALWPLPNLIPAIAAVVIWLTFMALESSIYRKSAEKLEATRLSWQVGLFWLIKPINNCCFRAVHRNARFKNFTWQRHKTAK